MATLGIDLDGVCYPFIEELRKHAHTHHDIPLESMPVDFKERWSIEDAWGWPQDGSLYDVIIRTALDTEEIWYNGDPSPGCVDTLNMLHDVGHTIWIVTHRAVPGYEQQCQDATAWWLDTIGVRYDNIVYARDKTGHEIDLLLDDAPHNITAHEAAGERIVIWDAPHNRLAKYEHLERVTSWSEFADLIIRDKELAA